MLFLEKLLQPLLYLLPVQERFKGSEHYQYLLSKIQQSLLIISQIYQYKTSPQIVHKVCNFILLPIRLMNHTNYNKKYKINPYKSTKTNTETNDPKKRKQTILFLINQQRFYELQNHHALTTKNTQSKANKLSLTKLKFRSRIHTTKLQKEVLMTPRFKKNAMSETKLPTLKKKYEVKQQFFEERLAPWQYKESNQLMRPASSKLLYY